VESIEGCEDCAAEAAWERSQGHDCGKSSPRWKTLCEWIRDQRLESEEGHRLSHQPVRCENCDAVLNDRRGYWAYVHGRCASDLCEEWRCVRCKTVETSVGPIDCPTCSLLEASNE
jgi:hypothetical protein